MRKVLLFALVVAIASSGSVFSIDVLNDDQQRFLGQPDFLGYVPDRFVVILNDEVNVDHGKDGQSAMTLASMSGFDEIAVQFGVHSIRPQFPGSTKGAKASSSYGRSLARHYKVQFDQGTLEDAMAAFEANPMVASVEPIGIHTMRGTPNDGYYDDPPPTFPYDQWHYWDTYGIDADLAWNTQTGDATVVVGVLDSGVKYDHGDLGGSNPPGPNDASTNGNIWVNGGEIPGNGTDDDGNGYVDDVIGWDFVERTNWYIYNCVDLDCGGADNDPFDGNGHGTHVAGTIAAITNNGYAVAGISGGWGDGTFAGGGNGVKVVPCRIGYSMSYQGQTVGVVIMDYVAEAMYYMAELKISGTNVAAVNFSAGSSNSGGLSAATDYILAQDIMVIVAAGNGNTSSADYLGARTDCMDVGATDSNGNPASFSNYGSWVDIAAPGVDIMSTAMDVGDPGGDYVAPYDGTSMSCPHVVGVAAMLESADPSLSAQDKWDLIVNYSSPYNMSKDVGDGLLNAKASLDAIGPQLNPPVADFSGTPTSGDAPLTVSFTDLSTNTPTGWSWTFGDGGTSTAQNPSYEYTAAGSYTVSLTATNGDGSDGETKVNYITVTQPNIDPPVADFSGSPTSGEAPLTVSFTDLSTNTPTGWSWTFGDGGTSSAQNPSYEYTAAGTYTVILVATNTFGSDSATKVDYITVTEPGVGTKYFAQSESTGKGTVSGSYLNTQASDNSYEGFTEGQSGGKPSNRYSLLDHTWTFNVGTGATVSFFVEGYRPNNAEGDDFTFEYSTDNSNFTPLVAINSATEQTYSAAMASSTSGTVYVRIVDSDHGAGNLIFDDVYVDYMYIESGGTPPPPDTMYVSAVSVTRTGGKANKYRGVASVTVLDLAGSPIVGVTVTGAFSGPSSGSASGTTDGSGVATIQSGQVKSPSGNWCFDVTDVSLGANVYDPSQNVTSGGCETGFAWLSGAGQVPHTFELGQNYPNPFNPTTEISFSLPNAGYVKLEVFNITGQRVSVLADGNYSAGPHTITWDASRVASGVYLYRLSAGENITTRKMTLLK